MIPDSSWYVYLVRCSDNSLYCGITMSVEDRIKAHSAGLGAKYTRGRGPVTFVCSAGPYRKGTALRIEAATKKLPSSRKVNFLLYHE